MKADTTRFIPNLYPDAELFSEEEVLSVIKSQLEISNIIIYIYIYI